MTARQDSANLAWDRSDQLWEEKRNQLRLKTSTQKTVARAEKALGEPVVFAPPLMVGGFNVLYPIRVGGGSSHTTSRAALIRLPCRTEALFHEEKVRADCLTLEYIRQHTQLPVPEMLQHGNDAEIGPFMIIQDLKIRRDMSDALQMPGQDPDESPILDPNIPDSTIRSIYGQMARCLLQFAQPTFPRIGSLSRTNSGFEIASRPITLNMSNMVQLSNIPQSIFPDEHTTFDTADEWYTALAKMQIATLFFQHNDIISSADDCRTKYVARQLFYNLAKQGRLANFGFADCENSPGATLPVPDGNNSFRLWADDFRAANVLVDNDDHIAGIIDWEFTYAGPTQFVLDPPWWLLIEGPENWDDGIQDWASVYEGRLETWLSEVKKAEKEMSPGSLLLSAYMRESWKTGRFWVHYAARKSWAFDAIYWKYIDEKFFGKREFHGPSEELWRLRFELLSEEARIKMQDMVKIKMEESKERVLVDWKPEEARKRLEAFLF
ncbi:hypothetical protein V8F06_010147 [Rhypophila decipiens]